MQACTVQLFHAGHWHDVASVSLLGPVQDGLNASTYTGYGTEWAIEHDGRLDALALCSGLPVSMQTTTLSHWPAFLIDMLPQGFGRTELLRQLGLPHTLEAAGDWRLLLAGAGNPIGHLRVKEAADALAERPGPRRGFTDEEVAARAEEFAEYLASHGLFVAGSSGVQGEWPKLLMTRAQDGLLYLDHTLADDAAAPGTAHYIVKFGRGPDEQLAKILRHEAPYMDIAARLGLRVFAPLALRGRALFIPRFDRVRRQGQLVRLAQESVATLLGITGFGALAGHGEICARLAAVCTDPAAEVLEYLRRDVANLALGNKDNHARNTALQRDFGEPGSPGRISLAPLFDFAPMYLHPDGIARRIRWLDNDGGAPDWDRVLDTVCQTCGLPREPLARGLVAMAPVLSDLAAHGTSEGLEPDVHRFLQPGLAAMAERLSRLH